MPSWGSAFPEQRYFMKEWRVLVFLICVMAGCTASQQQWQPTAPPPTAHTTVVPQRHVTEPVVLDLQRMAKPSTVPFDAYVEAKAGGLVLSEKRHGEYIYFATEMEIDGKWRAYVRRCPLPPDEKDSVEPSAAPLPRAPQTGHSEGGR